MAFNGVHQPVDKSKLELTLSVARPERSLGQVGQSEEFRPIIINDNAS